jgi:hypothetical protein
MTSVSEFGCWFHISDVHKRISPLEFRVPRLGGFNQRHSINAARVCALDDISNTLCKVVSRLVRTFSLSSNEEDNPCKVSALAQPILLFMVLVSVC